jgi:hypothetical protein
MSPRRADASRDVVDHLDLQAKPADGESQPNESCFPCRDRDLPARLLLERLDETIGPQREIGLVVGEEVEVVGEAVMEVAPRGRGPSGQVEPGLERGQQP